MTPELGIGMVGYGFMGKVHTHAYLNLPLFYDPVPARIKLVGVCTSRRETGRKAIGQAGYEFATTDYRELLKREDIQIVHCCLPNYLHRELLIAAIKAGKHIYCDKPLAMNLKEAKEIIETVTGAGIKHQMTFEYRFIPAMMRAEQLIREGFLGKVLSFRASYLHSGYVDPERPMSWRLEKHKSGGGALFDLGSHVLDLLRYLSGEYEPVYAGFETFTKKRPQRKNSPEKAEVEVDDLALLQIRMENGALGTVEASRIATGTNDELRIEIHGTQGAIYFNLMEPNWLQVYDNREKGDPLGGDRGFKKIETVQRYPQPAVLPGPKFAIGWLRYHIHSQYEFITSIAEDRPSVPSLNDGYKVQEIMEAAYLSSRRKSWVRLVEL
jgi:predicted dehydrogenase